MLKSLVTGGAGFIGSHVTDHLLNIGHQVVVLDDLSGGNKDNISLSAIFIHGSITDDQIVKEIFQDHNFDYVFHMAAYAAEGLSHFVRNFNYQNNIIGSTHLINAAIKHNIKCFVFTSSIAVYGKNPLPMREEDTPHPIDPYGIAKYAIELDLKAAHEVFGLNYIIFRPHNVYGERQNIHDPYRNVIGIFINQIVQNKPLTIFGDGNQTRAFSHINDVAPQIARSIQIGKAINETFNIGADRPHTIKEIANKVCQLMNSNTEIRYLDARHEVLHAHTDHHKLRTLFHIQENQQVSLTDGLEKMIRWVKKNKNQSSHIHPNLEIEKNLPANWKNNE